MFFATNIVESSTCAQNFVKKNIPNALGEERKIDSPEKTIFKAFWSADFVIFLQELDECDFITMFACRKKTKQCLL